jgi:hypothetical protein
MVGQEEEWWLYASMGRPPEIPELPFKIPDVLAEDNPPGLAQNVPPVVVKLKPGATLVSQKYYFIPCKAQVGIQKHFDRLKIRDPLTLPVILEHQSINWAWRISGQFRTSRQ